LGGRAAQATIAPRANVACKIYNFTLTVCAIAAIVSAIRDCCYRRLRAMRSIEVVVRNFRRMSSNVCHFFVTVFIDESSSSKSFRFPQVLIKMLSLELNTLPYFISLYHYWPAYTVQGARLVTVTGVCRRLSSVTLHGGPAGGFDHPRRPGNDVMPPPV